MNLRNLSQKWKSFGWDVISIDGHNVKEIANSLKRQSKKPLAIIANTIKGKGFREFENNNDWHHKVITQEHYKKLLKEIK
jgi:transketolase